MYTLLGSPGSRSTRVMWMLEELGEPYEFRKAKPHAPEVSAVNPSGRLPVLVDGDLALSDSAAICVYLGEKHADKGMAARSPAERARMDAWAHFIQSELEQPLWNKFKHKLMLPDGLRAEVSAWAAWEFGRDVEALSRRLGEQQFALGDRFTAIDVLLAHVLNWARNAKFGPFPANVDAYADRLLSRPAYARTKQKEAAA
jgi:glutathione S-transferase